MARDSQGRATVRAIRIEEPLKLDGVLDEAVFRDVPSFGDFVQATPVSGAPSSERSEVWILYDDRQVYVVCRCWDSAPPSEWVANELRRDTNGLRQNDHFGVMFDTFYDRRSGFGFYANPLGGRADYSVVDEGASNSDWNPVWDVATGTFDGGWTMEMAIPLTSLRYRSGPNEMWGVQFRRSIRRKNEWAFLTPLPAHVNGPQGLNQISYAATLVGLDLPPAGRNVELRPYLIGGFREDRVNAPDLGRERSGDLGLDLRYGITANLTADLTVNTDFAQVEVDEQQVNLTRFSLLFPEKREFFLEGRGVFDFGRGSQGMGPGGGGGGGGGGWGGGGGGDAPFLFYSRRIGFEAGRVVPIEVGGRVTGKVGNWGVGALSIRTGEVEGEGTSSVGLAPTQFNVVRVKRDVFGRSTLGAMFTHRTRSPSSPASEEAYGIDGIFRFFEGFRLSGYWASTPSDAPQSESSSWQGSLDWTTEPMGINLERLEVGPAFNPGVGFARRRDFEKTAGTLRLSRRPSSLAGIRRINLEGGVDYFGSQSTGRLQTRQQSGQLDVELESSDRIRLNADRNAERLDTPFRVGPDLVISPGFYNFDDVRLTLQSGAQRRVAANLSFRMSSFYGGTLRSVGLSGARVVVSNQLSLEPGITWNQVDHPEGSFRQTLLRTRADYAFTPRMFAGALVQYNSVDGTLSTNIRYRWEYRPGSEFFLVFTDERDAGGVDRSPNEQAFPGAGLRNRALTLKATRLLTF